MAGLVVGNMKTRVGEELREFKEQLTVLLIGMLFVLLSADVRFSEVQALGWNGLLVVACLVFLVRPLNVLVGTVGLPVSLKEKAFLAWVAPRGIVAAAVASYFAVVLEEAGISGGNQLRALVFMVIAVTVTLSGLTGGMVAQMLGVRRKNKVGYVVLGADPLGLAMGRVLQEYGEEVTFIDNNPDHTSEAQEEGFRVVFGNALEERTLMRARVDAAAGCLAITPNDELNYLFSERIYRQFRGPKLYIALHFTKGVVTKDMMERVEARMLFGALRHVELWSVRARRKLLTPEVWTKESKGTGGLYQNPQEPSDIERAYLPIARIRKGKAVPVDQSTQLAKGDGLAILMFEEARKEATESLRNLGLESGKLPV